VFSEAYGEGLKGVAVLEERKAESSQKKEDKDNKSAKNLKNFEGIVKSSNDGLKTEGFEEKNVDFEDDLEKSEEL
jgi:hypothetical protein